ncbi:MAG: lipopolysaccharide biosynthesis protein, partial [Sphingomonas bacterium]|nr:lipopolysaccharide biosynthesis protein [Sphingomonas bacterium]
MNMYGVLAPQSELDDHGPGGRWSRVTGWARSHRTFLGVVMLPVLLTMGYLFLIASDQYQSEAHFLVRTTDAGVTGGIGVSQVLSAATGLSAA